MMYIIGPNRQFREEHKRFAEKGKKLLDASAEELVAKIKQIRALRPFGEMNRG